LAKRIDEIDNRDERTGEIVTAAGLRLRPLQKETVMGEVADLNRVRKAQTKATAEKTAATNRVKHLEWPGACASR
jgi:hypothetical protein